MSNIRQHENFIEIHPLKRCVWVGAEDRCALCPEIEASFPETILSLGDEEKLLFQIEKILHNKRGRCIIVFRTSFNENRDRGLLEVEKFIIKLKRWFDARMILEMLPTPELSFLDHAYGIGVDAIIVNLAVYNRGRFNELFPRKEKVIGYDQYWRYFEHASKVFPSGAVFSQLMPGVEPLKDTHQGIEQLMKIGVLPFLDIFTPLRPGFTPLEGPQKLALVIEVLKQARRLRFNEVLFRGQTEALKKFLSVSERELDELLTTWTPGQTIVPLEAAAAAAGHGEELQPLDISLQNYISNYTSSFNGRLRLGLLSKVRRHLRVQTIRGGQ